MITTGSLSSAQESSGPEFGGQVELVVTENMANALIGFDVTFTDGVDYT